MRRLLVTVVAILIVTATPVSALEEGATFYDNGTCVEVDGTPGLSAGDGSCVTVADYDEMFSFENLSTVPSIIDPSISIAEEAGLDPEVPASLRLLGRGLVEVPRTYRELVNWLVLV